MQRPRLDPRAALAAALLVSACSAGAVYTVRSGQAWWTVALGAAVIWVLASAADRAEPLAWTRLKQALDGDAGFGRAVALLALVFLVWELLYAVRLPLSDDEFSGVAEAFKHRTLLPYRDFLPYKTVLGYYVQSLPLFLTRDLWTGILLIRVEMAVINTAMLLVLAFALRRHFRGTAVCLGLGLLVPVSTFLERSIEIRVDTLTSWCGVVSLLLLLERRAALAGLAAGVTFLVSQKGAYFPVAGGAVCGLWWLVVERDRRSFRDALLFAGAALATLVAYFAFWTSFTTFERTVLHVFRVGVDVGFGDYPGICPRDYWLQTVLRNPAFYGTALFALLRLGRGFPTLRDPARRVTVFGAVIFLLSLWHKQPCPHFFVIPIPVLAIVIVALCDRELAGGWQAVPARKLLALYLLAGVLFPLTRLQYTLTRDVGFQRNTLQLAESLLAPGETYLASFPLLYDRPQATPLLSWLDDVRRRRLKAMSPAELQAVIDELDATPLKLVVANYRMWDVPPALLDYVFRRYTPFWGNVYLYAPLLPAGERTFDLKFAGHYQVEIAAGRGAAVIDGASHPAGAVVELAAGRHQSAGALDVRLRLLPDTLDPELLDPRYKEPRKFFDLSFHY